MFCGSAISPLMNTRWQYRRLLNNTWMIIGYLSPKKIRMFHFDSDNSEPQPNLTTRVTRAHSVFIFIIIIFPIKPVPGYVCGMLHTNHRSNAFHTHSLTLYHLVGVGKKWNCKSQQPIYVLLLLTLWWVSHF